jgi:hypothetical protein
VLIYIQRTESGKRTESEEWIGTLINANDELVQTLAHYEKALKPPERDSDSEWSASDSEEEEKKKKVAPQRPVSTGGSIRSPVSPVTQTSTGSSTRSKTEDLAARLRASSISGKSPPPRPAKPIRLVDNPIKPPRPVVESPPAKPPRPTANARYSLCGPANVGVNNLLTRMMIRLEMSMGSRRQRCSRIGRHGWNCKVRWLFIFPEMTFTAQQRHRALWLVWI